MNMTDQDGGEKRAEIKIYSLPELDHRRRCVGVCNVGGIFSIVVNTVLCGRTVSRYYSAELASMNMWDWRQGEKNPVAYEQFPPPTCVPVVSAASPRQLSGETVEEVEDGPGQDHYIVHVQMRLNHLCCVADT